MTTTLFALHQDYAWGDIKEAIDLIFHFIQTLTCFVLYGTKIYLCFVVLPHSAERRPYGIVLT